MNIDASDIRLRNYLKTMKRRVSDTTAGYKRTEVGRGNFRLFSHSVREGLGISIAKPAYVLQPNGVRDGVGARRHRALPRQCGGYDQYNDEHGLPPPPSDCHSLYRDINVEDGFGLAWDDLPPSP